MRKGGSCVHKNDLLVVREQTHADRAKAAHVIVTGCDEIHYVNMSGNWLGYCVTSLS